MFTVTLHAPGNPDFRQYAPLGPSIMVSAETLAEISKLAMQYRHKYDLGGGNWAPSAVKDDTGEIVGAVSYNGKIWPPQSSTDFFAMAEACKSGPLYSPGSK